MERPDLFTRIKHLRGKHDQLDHAWNRGMGQGGYGAGLAPNQMGPLPTESFYRKRLTDLTEQRRRGEITRAEMRRQMRDLRGITTAIAPTLTLANTSKRKKPKLKTGKPSDLAPMPIDAKEFKPTGKVYKYFKARFNFEQANNIRKAKTDDVYQFMIESMKNDRGRRDDPKQIKLLQDSLSFFYDAQGYDELPNVVSWDEIINPSTDVVKTTNGNPMVFYRSVMGIGRGDTTGIDRGLEYMEDMRSGKRHYPGMGVSGFGTYAKTENVYGENYTQLLMNQEISRIFEQNNPNFDYTNDANLDLSSVSEYVEYYNEALRGIANQIQKINALVHDADKKKWIKDNPKWKSQYVYRILGFIHDELTIDGTDLARNDILNSQPNNWNYDYSRTRISNNVDDLTDNLRVFDITRNLPSDLSQDEQKEYQTFMKSYLNELMKLKSIVHGLFYVPNNDRKKVRQANAQVTRDNYGKETPYTVGFTINGDARIPESTVNKGTNGGSSSYDVPSSDALYISEFLNRYPMFKKYISGESKRDFPDIGIIMTILGWDAYHAHVGTYSTNSVLLNRGVLNMSDSTLGIDGDINTIV